MTRCNQKASYIAPNGYQVCRTCLAIEVDNTPRQVVWDLCDGGACDRPSDGFGAMSRSARLAQYGIR